jgi:hypothetical protein
MAEQPSIRCERCGGTAVYRVEGSTQGYYCTACDWAVVTSFIPAIKKDTTLYDLRIHGGDHHSKPQIRTVAQVGGINVVEARKLLQQPAALVMRGMAEQIQHARTALSETGLTVVITPEFPW